MKEDRKYFFDISIWGNNFLPEILQKNNNLIITEIVNKGDKIAVLSKNSLAASALYKILSGEDTDFTGSFKWGVTINAAYLPADNHGYFDGKKLNLVDWLRADVAHEEISSSNPLRGFARDSASIDYSRPVAKSVRFVAGVEVRRWTYDNRFAQGAALGIHRKDWCKYRRISWDQGWMPEFDRPFYSTAYIDQPMTKISNGLSILVINFCSRC